MDYSGHKDKVIVIKISGKVVGDDAALRTTLNQLIALKEAGCHVILVHGGGDQIDDALDAKEIAYHKTGGVRHTSDVALPVVEETLFGLNAMIVAKFLEEAEKRGSKVCAVGLDLQEPEGKLIFADVKFDGTRTGKVSKVDEAELLKLVKGDKVPIFHSICHGSDGTFNVNADEVGMAVSEAVSADRFILGSNTCMMDAAGKPLVRLAIEDLDDLIADGTIHTGAVVKVQACKTVLLSGRVKEVIILNGRDGSLVKELENDPEAGTHMVKTAS